MLLSAMSVLVVAQSSSEIPEGLMNNPVYIQLSSDVIFLNLFVRLPVCLPFIWDCPYFVFYPFLHCCDMTAHYVVNMNAVILA